MSMTKETPDAPCRGLEVYRVGGVVRDRLLGRRADDADYVVVGATPEEMKARGVRPVGRDFPVFLHPQTAEEYALARTRSEEHTSELQSRGHLVRRVLLAQKKT